jgi:glycosyltransferase involved in cell wall biosynthesis
MTLPRRLRLVLVTETFPPEVNGAARTLGRWVETFQARGHSVAVIRPRRPAEGPGPDRVHALALPFYPQVRVGAAGPSRLRAMLGRLAPDLVHIATEGPLGWAALVAARRLGLPIASSFHTNFDHYAGHYGFLGLGRLARAYLRWFHNQTRLTLVPSRATRRRLTGDGFQRVEIWSRGVDAEAFHPRHRDEALRASLGLGPADLLLLYVGRLAPEKNLGALLEAFARLRQQGPTAERHGGRSLRAARLALVGDGPLAGALRLRPPPGVLLAGVKHGLELSRWYASADVFAFPSLSETFGNVVLEAQASGLPVVGFDCQGVNERVKDGEDGLLTNPAGDLAGPLLEMCRDGEQRLRLGRAARAVAERQGWGPIFDELEERYLGLAGGRAAGRKPAGNDTLPGGSRLPARRALYRGAGAPPLAGV